MASFMAVHSIFPCAIVALGKKMTLHNYKPKKSTKNHSIYLYISAGLEFFESANGVILCGGDQNGVIPPNLFAKVVHRKKGNNIVIISNLAGGPAK